MLSWPSHSAMVEMSTPAWRRAMAHVWGGVLGAERGAVLGGRVGIFDDQRLDGIRAERAPAAGWEQGIGRVAVAFGQPCPQRCHGGWGEWRAAFLPGFAVAADVGSGCKLHVGAAQGDQLC